MKKFFAFLLVGISIITMSSSLFVGCKDEEKADWMKDLTGYVANISDATALGIATNAEEDAVSYQNARSSSVPITPLSTQTLSRDNKDNDKKYIVKKTTEYEANAPEADETGLTKVTFTKIVTEENKKEEKIVTQEEVGGEIDKLYVLGEYTFISYVPEGESKRPADGDLSFDTDGISLYDKCDYFSNGQRQSFIIDNQTGYVYKLKDFNIKEIQGGCLISKDDNFIYDFKINENDEVEIFSLFTNDTIEWYSCFKDKYGNKFIQNNRLNTYDATTHTYFYVHEPFVNSEYEQYNGYIIYELTSNNEAIALYYSNNQTSAQWSTLIDAYIILENGTKRELTSDDSFEIYYDWDKFNQLSYFKRYDINAANSLPEQDWTAWHHNNRTAYKVVNGVVYGYSHHKGYSQGLVLMQYDVVKKEATYLSLNYPSGAFVNTSNLEKHDILIEFQDGKLYYYSNVWDAYTQACGIHEDLFLGDSDYDKEYLSDYESFAANLVLENCSIDGIKDAVMAYGIHGNTYYEIVAEEVNGEVVIKQYVKGTYQKPQIKIILQPLNKNA